jgi:hypothetical protein
MTEQLARFADLICQGRLDARAAGDRSKPHTESWRG